MANSPGRSIRAPADFWKALDAFAAEKNMRPGPALVYAAKIGMGNPGPAPAAKKGAAPSPRVVLAEAEAAAAHLATPKKLSPKQREWRSAIRKVPVGQTDAPAGSRLKSAPKPARR